MLTRRLLVVLAAVVLVVVPLAPVALAATPVKPPTCDPPYRPDPSNQVCTLYVGGTASGPGTGGTHGSGSNDCGNVPADELYTLPNYTFVPCYDPTYGWWDPANQCWITRSAPQPVPGFRAASQAQDPAWHPNWSVWTSDWLPMLLPTPPPGQPARYKEGDGVVYSGHCYVHAGHGDWVDMPVWAPSVTAPPTVPQLLTQAEAQIHMTGAQFAVAPSPTGTGLVGMPVWLANVVTPQTWGPQSATVSAGGTSLTAVATAVSITWDMGDGHTVVCANPGTPYTPSAGKSASPTCGYTYTRFSGGQPGGQYRITATTLWQVAWQASTGATGVVTPAPATVANTTVRIGELQVVGG